MEEWFMLLFDKGRITVLKTRFEDILASNDKNRTTQ